MYTKRFIALSTVKIRRADDIQANTQQHKKKSFLFSTILTKELMISLQKCNKNRIANERKIEERFSQKFGAVFLSGNSFYH